MDELEPAFSLPQIDTVKLAKVGVLDGHEQVSHEHSANIHLQRPLHYKGRLLSFNAGSSALPQVDDCCPQQNGESTSAPIRRGYRHQVHTFPHENWISSDDVAYGTSALHSLRIV